MIHDHDNIVMTEFKKVIVYGATGRQGSHVISALLESKEFQVVCFIRSKSYEKATKFKEKGCIVFKGDLCNYDDVSNAMKGCYGAFFYTGAFIEIGEKALHQQYTNFIKACRENPTVFPILTNSTLHQRGSKVKVFEKMVDYEDIITQELNGCTIKPCGLMDELCYVTNKGAYVYKFTGTCLETPYKADEPLPATALEDLGIIVRIVFQNREKYQNQRIPINADMSTPNELVKVLSEVHGSTITYKEVPFPSIVKWLLPDLVKLVTILPVQLNEEGYKNMKEMHPNALSYKSFAQKFKFAERNLKPKNSCVIS